MRVSIIRWLLAWLATVILAPILFVLCLAAWSALNDILGFLPPRGFFGELITFSKLPRLWPIIMIVGAAMALIPTVVIGMPISLMLQEQKLLLLRHFALAGAIGGCIGGLAMVVLGGGLVDGRPFMPKLEFALLGSIYGAFAMLVFRLLSGRR